MKFSYIVPMSNFKNTKVDFISRTRNLKKMLHKIPKYIEVILVEQITNKKNRLYTDHIGLEQLKNIKNIKRIVVEHEYFNKCWCYNIGVKNSSSDNLLLVEMDMFIEDRTYFSKLYKFIEDETIKWCFGWSTLSYLKEDGTIREVVEPKPGFSEGGIIYCNKEFYWLVGGANEFVEGLGGPDNEFVVRLKSFSNSYKKFDHNVTHQWHPKGLDLEYKKLRNQNIKILNKVSNPEQRKKIVQILRSNKPYLGEEDGPVSKKLKLKYKPNQNVLDRERTLHMLEDMVFKRKRVVVSRYSDGERLLIAGTGGKHFSDEHSKKTSELLLNSLRYKDQFLTIPYLKNRNIKEKDPWCKIQSYLMINSGHDFFGNCNWNIYDFQRGSNLISKFFKGRILFISGFANEVKKKLGAICNMDIYSTVDRNATQFYDLYKEDLIKKVRNKEYDNIILSCGPLSKILLADLEPICKSNIIDFGALCLVFINKCHIWTMSWVRDYNIQRLYASFVQKVKKENNR